MKNLYFLAIAVLIPTLITAQLAEDIVTTGPSYENQVWYNMASGEVASAPLNNWDIAFEITGFTSSIRANTQKGLFVYEAPYAINEWEALVELDGSWPELYNDITSWNRGAFNLHPTSDFDLGWGIYNPITHFVNGDSLYVVQLTDGTLKKLRLDVLAPGVYTFTYANLDGSDEQQKQLVKSDFTGKNFGYFSFETGEAIDREPLSEDWDITFKRYTENIQGQSYAVSGIQHNYGVRTSEVGSTPTDEASPWQADFVEEINQIGYDWKNFSFGDGWVLQEDLSYFVEAQNGSVYQIVFTGFGGTGTGVYEFTVTLNSALSTSTSETLEFIAFPNPLSAGSLLTLEGNFSPSTRLEVFSIDGRMINEQVLQGSSQVQLSTSGFDAGTYLIRIISNDQALTQKVIINN